MGFGNTIYWFNLHCLDLTFIPLDQVSFTLEVVKVGLWPQSRGSPLYLYFWCFDLSLSLNFLFFGNLVSDQLTFDLRAEEPFKSITNDLALRRPVSHHLFWLFAYRWLLLHARSDFLVSRQLVTQDKVMNFLIFSSFFRLKVWSTRFHPFVLLNKPWNLGRLAGAQDDWRSSLDARQLEVSKVVKVHLLLLLNHPPLIINIQVNALPLLIDTFHSLKRRWYPPWFNLVWII